MSTFRYTVNDVFNIRGRGPVVTGHIESGSVAVGQPQLCSGPSGVRTVRVAAIEKFKQRGLQEAAAGPEDVGLELTGATFDEVHRQDVLTSAQLTVQGDAASPSALA